MEIVEIMNSPSLDVEEQQITMQPAFRSDQEIKEREVDYSKRSQWLRAAVLGAIDGLVSTASLMMGIGAVKHDIKVMILTGFAGLVAGACSMAIGEFVSVYSQLDTEVAAQKKRNKRETQDEQISSLEEIKKRLPIPKQAAAVSAVAFSVGALVPLLAASFIRDYKVRIGAIVGAVTVALLVFGRLAAYIGNAPAKWSGLRLLLGGWVAMAITYGLTMGIGASAL